VKKLTVALLIVATCASTLFAQSTEQDMRDRHKVLLGWVGIVRTAEYNYKNDHGGYGKLTDLRKSHLLDALVFESDEPAYAYAETGSDVCVIPKDTFFRLTVSRDGQHYKVEVHSDVGNKTLTMFANEASTGVGDCRTRHQTYLRKIVQKDRYISGKRALRPRLI
jgi:hypothetical protein